MIARQCPPFELPPTAGLPSAWTDLWRTPPEPFLDGLKRWLGLPNRPLVTCSGTAALVVALRTLKQRQPQRTKVIIPAYTCTLVAQAVVKAGLQPLVCDTEADGFDLSSNALASMCNDSVLAVVPTHLGGRVADLDPVLALAAPHRIAVIEDAAQSMGAMDHGQSVGLRGDVGFFSLAAGKGLTTYEGGVLFSRDPELHEALQRQSKIDLPFSAGHTLRRIVELCGYLWFYHPKRLSLVYGRPLRAALAKNDLIGAVGDIAEGNNVPLHRMDGLRLRAAGNALPRLPASLEQGRQQALRRLDDLRMLGLTVIADRPDTEGTWPFFMVLLPTEFQRDQALRALWRGGMGVTRLFIHALPDYPQLQPVLKEVAPCSHARDMAARMLTLSNTPWMDDEMWQRILAVLRKDMALP